MANSPMRAAVVKELLALDQLEDREEVERRMDLLQKILEYVYDYESHLCEYDFYVNWQCLRDRGMVIELVDNPAEIRQKWEDIFATALSPVQKESIFYDTFRWHIFSYALLQPVIGLAANDAFLHCKKTECYIFFQNADECYSIENLHLLLAHDITNPQFHDYVSDFYIFDAVEKWTFVCTHEENCGPYFYQAT